MSIKPVVLATIAGGITIFAIGTLIFVLPPLAEFYTYAMTSGSATGVPRCRSSGQRSWAHFRTPLW